MLSGAAKWWWFSALAVLGGCASVQDMVGVPRTGYQSDGTYVVSDEEEKLACRQLEGRLAYLDRQIQVLPQQVVLESESRPSTVGSALGRMFGGSGDGLKATRELQRARAESDALRALMIRKQCV
ncbi:hypothetical protein [Hyphomicrobium sp.]|uniref:hypothetical protein n=1 Tax=Hyphomicrobium sp. TaxID=82 RepID=UPI0025C21C80|nr:hypothetical protein [Hyphomicrobium sp.]MCC7253895.1 hypothetical protein [Hyphomicrobium sp.]